jgi:hypothetical protein
MGGKEGKKKTEKGGKGNKKLKYKMVKNEKEKN